MLWRNMAFKASILNWLESKEIGNGTNKWDALIVIMAQIFVVIFVLAQKNLTMPFTDISESAAWKATIGDRLNPPWPIDNPPTICKLMNFSASFLLPDLLHVWYLGVGRDVVGSVMLLLIRTQGFLLVQRKRPDSRMLRTVSKPGPEQLANLRCQRVGSLTKRRFQ